MLMQTQISIISSILALQLVFLPDFCGANRVEVNKLIDQYHSGDLTEKRLAIKSLKNFREGPLFMFFVEASQHQDHFIRRHAFEGISHFQTEDAYQVLKKSLIDISPFVVRHSIPLFSHVSFPDVGDLLLPLLESKDNQILHNAINTLGYVGNNKTIFDIAPFLNDPHEKIQSLAYQNTGFLLQKFKEGYLKGLDADFETKLKKNTLKSADKLTDIFISSFNKTWANGSNPVRKNALWCLGSFAETYMEQLATYIMFEEDQELLSLAENIKKRLTSAVPVLLESYSKLQEEELRWYLVSSLSKFKTEDAIQVFLQGLGDDFYMVRAASIQGLLKLENSDFMPEIIHLLNDPTEIVRTKVLKAIEQIGPSESASQIISYLSSDSSQIKWSSAKALGSLENEEAVGPLISLLNSNDGLIRAIAVQSLGELGFGEAVPFIIKASNDKLYLVRVKTAYALGNFGPDEASFSTLIKLLSDQNRHVRRSALNSLFIILRGPENQEKFKNKIPIIVSIIKKDEDRAIKAKVPKFIDNIKGRVKNNFPF